MRATLKGIKQVFRREVRQIAHDFNITLVVLVAPLIYALFYGSIYMHKTEQDIPIVVVDNDHTELSRLLIRDLDAHQSIKVEAAETDIGEARAMVQRLECEGTVFIPEGFERSLKNGVGCDLHISLNTSRFLVSNDLNKAITEVVTTLAAGVKIKFFEAKGYSQEQALQAAEPLLGEVRPLFNPVGSYGDFFLPGLLMLILQQTMLIGLAESIAKEREERSLPDLRQNANLSAIAAVIGKGGCYLAIYSAYALFFFVVVFPFYRLPVAGSSLALATLTLLLLVTIIPIAIFVSSFFDSKIRALQFLAMSSIPIFLISGYSWPTESMPRLLQWLSQLIPTTPYLHAFIRVSQMGAGWSHVTGEMLQLLLLAGVWLVVCLWRIRRLFAGIEPSP